MGLVINKRWMLPKLNLVSALAGLCVCLNVAKAELPITYQVTGPIIELSDDKIVVQKGDERWELARDKNTKVKGDIKVGSKVTIEYRMIATQIQVRDDHVDSTKKATKKKSPAEPKPSK